MTRYAIVNKKRFEIEPEFSISEKATEELDNCVFVICAIEEQDFQPLDQIQIVIGNGSSNNSYFFVIDTIIKEVAKYDDPRLYNYTIKGISETTKLDRIILPNLQITKRKNKNPLTILEHIQMVWSLYIYTKFPELTLSQDLKNLLLNEEANEQSFTSCSARDYFNQILLPLNKIVKIENNQISFISFDEKKNQIDVSKLDNDTETMALSDYYSDIKCYAQNCQSKNENVINEFVAVRAPESAVLTTENAKLYLSHKIDQINEVYIICQYKNKNSQTIVDKVLLYRKGDTKNKFACFCEKEIYDYLLPSNKQSFDFANDKIEDYKRFRAYFTRGSNIIDGLFYNEGTWFFGVPSKTAIENIFEYATYKQNGESSSIESTDLRKISFLISYTAKDDVSFVVQKSKNENRNFSEIIDNQQNEVVDALQFSKTEYQKVNRLGNKARELSAVYDIKSSKIPQLLDYDGDYIIGQIEKKYSDNSILILAYAYKDFIIKNKYYGVNAKRRSYNLISGKDAVKRKEIYEYQFYFDFVNVQEYNQNIQQIEGYLITNLIYSSNQYWWSPNLPDNHISRKRIMEMRPFLGTIETFDKEGNQINELFVVPKVDNTYRSISMNFTAYDNINIGLSVSFTQENGGYGQSYQPYTDKVGECDSCIFSFYTKCAPTLGLNNENEIINKIHNSSGTFPNLVLKNTLNWDDRLRSTKIRLLKDNSEIIDFNWQFTFKSNKNVIIGEKFIQNLALISPYPYSHRCYILYSTEETYEIGDEFAVESARIYPSQENADYLINYMLDEYYFTNTNETEMLHLKTNLVKIQRNGDPAFYEKVKSWAVCDDNRRILIAVNSNTDTIYLNCDSPTFGHIE